MADAVAVSIVIPAVNEEDGIGDVIARLCAAAAWREVLTSAFGGARLDCLREFLHPLPNGFSRPTTTTRAFIRAGCDVTFVPIEAQPRRAQLDRRCR